MKVRMVLSIQEIARRAMAAREPEAPRTAKGLATREAIRDCVQDMIGDLGADYYDSEIKKARAQPPDEYRAHEVKAAEWLKSNGKTPEQVAEWLLLQRAIFLTGNEVKKKLERGMQ